MLLNLARERKRGSLPMAEAPVVGRETAEQWRRPSPVAVFATLPFFPDSAEGRYPIKNLEARVAIEPTHKGFADLARQFGWVSMHSYCFIESSGYAMLRPSDASPSKRAPATVSATVEPRNA